jgi:hypothetical protein
LPLHREEELPELETLVRAGASPIKAQGGVESKQGKANVLIQVMILAWRHNKNVCIHAVIVHLR